MKSLANYIKALLILVFGLFIHSVQLSSQAVSINSTGTPPHPSAILDLSEDNKGMVFPKVSAFPQDPAEGLLLFRDDLKAFFMFDGSQWQQLEGIYGGGNGIKVDENNEIALNFSAQQPGDIMVFDGQSWTCINAGQENQVLTVRNGMPVWESVSMSANPNPVHYVGESFGGGTVFYVDPSGNHGLIAAPADLSGNYNWSNGPFIEIGATENAIYGGQANTQTIIDSDNPGDHAALAARNYAGGGYNDWFLPSLTELQMMINIKNTIGGFNNNYYWSSTEAGTYSAWCVFSLNEESLVDNKQGPARVRPIRRF